MARISWKRDGRHVRDHTEETFSADYGAISTRSILTFPVTSADDKSVFECKAKSDDLPAVITNVTIRVRRKLNTFMSLMVNTFLAEIARNKQLNVYLFIASKVIKISFTYW